MHAVKADDLQRQQLEHFILVENCLIAEIHRLAGKIPADFVDPSNSRYSRLLTDFSYFEDKARFDQVVENDEEIRVLDDDFYLEFNVFLKIFHKLTNEVCLFIQEFVEYSQKCILNQNLLDRRFLLLNSLKSEALFLLGIILLLIDVKFPGLIKERIFIAFYRSSVDLSSKNLELLVSLLRNRKEGFESCFSSIKINIRFVEHVVNFLKNCSLAQQSDGTHDVFVGDKQAAMVYVILYFHPDILHNQQGLMRQIVDKYFQDRWMIPLHFELTGNLVEKWSRFKAANFALNAVLDAGMVARKATELGLKLRSMTIPAGLLNVEELGEHGRLIFEYNNILRWLVLSSDNKSGDSNLSKIVFASSRLGQEELFADFVKMAHFEHKFRQSCVYLVKNKVAECDRLKSRINVLFDQVIQVLSNNLFESQTWNERLKNWMTTIKDCISGLNGEDVETPQVLQHLAEKIAEVAEMHDSEQKILKQYLSLVLNDLQKFRNVCLMDSEFISRLDEQRDACFVWDLFQSWIPALENLLKTDAVAVKFIFLKLSFSIENILKTILKPFPEQSKVLSKFYHRKLELQLRKIIQTIPRSIFIQMDGLQPLFSTNKVVQIEKLNLKQFADLGRRRLLAQKTYEIAKLSLGISSMCLSKLGPIEIEPKELLFDGLRQELRLKLAAFLAEELAAGNVLKTLALQTTKIHTFRNAFLFICEHIGFNGVALWQSELESVFNAAFQAEKENLKSKAPKNAPNLKNPKPKPIVGQVIHDLVKQTNPRTTVYFCMTDEWYSADLRKLEFSSDFFTVIEKWLPAIANVGLKRLISFSIHSHKKTALQELTSSAAIFEPFPEMNWKSISATLDSAGFIVFAKKMIEIASKIGQLTIVDACLAKTVQESLHARIEDVVCSVKNLLNSLAIDKKNGLKLESKPFEQSPEFVSMIERLDLYGKLAKRKLNVPNHVGFAIFGVLIHYLSTVTTSKKIEFSDNFVITTGLLTLAKLLNSMEKVEILVKLFISDANILANLKCLPSVKCVLGIQNIPEALKK